MDTSDEIFKINFKFHGHFDSILSEWEKKLRSRFWKRQTDRRKCPLRMTEAFQLQIKDILESIVGMVDNYFQWYFLYYQNNWHRFSLADEISCNSYLSKDLGKYSIMIDLGWYLKNIARLHWYNWVFQRSKNDVKERWKSFLDDAHLVILLNCTAKTGCRSFFTKYRLVHTWLAWDPGYKSHRELFFKSSM